MKKDIYRVYTRNVRESGSPCYVTLSTKEEAEIEYERTKKLLRKGYEAGLCKNEQLLDVCSR